MVVCVYYYSCNLSLNEKEVLFADISNPNTSLYKIIDLIKPVDEWAEIAFSGSQNAENEHRETLRNLVNKLIFHHWTCLYKTLIVVFVYYYTSNLSLRERDCLCRYLKPQHKFIENHWLNQTRWRMSKSRIFSSSKCLK